MHGIGKCKAPEDDRELKLANLNIPIDQVIEELNWYLLMFRLVDKTNVPHPGQSAPTTIY